MGNYACEIMLTLHHPVCTLFITFMSGVFLGFAASGGAGAALAAAYLNIRSERAACVFPRDDDDDDDESQTSELSLRG
jgi:hypothetical protein